ncbi:uncharacterized protein LOC129595466 [Paramacrobiotus metropolitanus]|uniref:uncharacterized protein LOC129595466 n=1 Tax=Paramacrobiotus metropolitanus TaxID=2943436 RepID=UPI00244583FB|nr:uncharacterized protein LOC129595466 [Paramacrobiotus metropolitanus]
MLVYGEDSENDKNLRRVYQWNSVDVLTENGLFQHGEVVDVAEDGLIVDFDCSGQRAQFVSCDKIFHSAVAPSSTNFKKKYAELEESEESAANHSVEVLYRSHPDAAWLWYPGRLLSPAMFFHPDKIGLIIVQLQQDGELQQAELFSLYQVRFPLSKKLLAKRALQPNAFVLRECRLGRDHESTVPPGFVDRYGLIIQKTQRVHVVSITGRSLMFFQRSDEQPLTEIVKNNYEAIREAIRKSEAEKRADLGLPSSDIGKKRQHPGDDDAQPHTGGVIPTAMHLLRETFDSLDTISREKLRRVCSLWNSILTGPGSGKTVRISFATNPLVPPETKRVCGAVNGVSKCVSSETQRLIVEHVMSEAVENVLTVLGWMLRHVHIKQLILHDVGIDWELYTTAQHSLVVGAWIRPITVAFDNLTPFCGELMMYDCLFFCTSWMEASIPQARIKLLDPGDIEAQFWDIYEAHLSRDAINLGEIAQ